MKISAILTKVRSLLVDPPSPEQTFRRTLVLCVFLLGVIGFCLHKAGVIAIHDIRIKPGEVDLSGTWKYKLDDNEAYSKAALNDSDWCLIRVPDAGLRAKPLSEKDHPSADCPKEAYPKERMRNSTYWYRKEVNIPPGAHWERPSLFLGAVKDEAWVYWNGEFIGSTTYESLPSILLLRSTQINLGNNQIAIRMKTSGTTNPGMFHGFPKGVAIGDYKDMSIAISWISQLRFELFGIVLLQAMTLCLLFFFILRTQGANETHFWLAIYIASSCVNSSVEFTAGSLKFFLLTSSFTWMSIALAGYGSTLFCLNKNRQHFAHRTLLTVGVISITIQYLAITSPRRSTLPLEQYGRIIAIYSLIYFAIGFYRRASKDIISKIPRPAMPSSEFYTAISLGLMHIVVSADCITFGILPFDLHQNLLASLLTTVIVILAIEDYVGKEKQLTFFGRFVRPGLRQLLIHNKMDTRRSGEWFRGKKIPVIKVDIVGYTQSTFGMPYGLKRLFQDLWFKHVDEVLAGKAFFDKAEGDGSVYFLSENLNNGSCNAAMEAVLKIREAVIPLFDQAFHQEALKFINAFSELRAPMEDFLKSYTEKTHERFWDRKTRVRFALVYGFVDEGLWGMKSQSHYDLQGDLLIILSRLEKFASDREIVVTEEFLKQWQDEDVTVTHRVTPMWKEAELKGIGNFRYALISIERNEKERSAA